ncbi:hypothetical protein llap_20179 [Limosa lapponica baueri]|uniref:Uncharacterized protein n=1 Tax=Limosa lapponica baueri TaxID=1758121 RepID=A0A2I0T6U3_LIMLA|nr:hypothetical protein llap_20179 [Limosa lapponica baueri]
MPLRRSRDPDTQPRASPAACPPNPVHVLPGADATPRGRDTALAARLCRQAPRVVRDAGQHPCHPPGTVAPVPAAGTALASAPCTRGNPELEANGGLIS